MLLILQFIFKFLYSQSQLIILSFPFDPLHLQTVYLNYLPFNLFLNSYLLSCFTTSNIKVECRKRCVFLGFALQQPTSQIVRLELKIKWPGRGIIRLKRLLLPLKWEVMRCWGPIGKGLFFERELCWNLNMSLCCVQKFSLKPLPRLRLFLYELDLLWKKILQL